MYLPVLYTPHTCCRRLCLVLGVLMGWSRLGVTRRGESSGKVGKTVFDRVSLCADEQKRRETRKTSDGADLSRCLPSKWTPNIPHGPSSESAGKC